MPIQCGLCGDKISPSQPLMFTKFANWQKDWIRFIRKLLFEHRLKGCPVFSQMHQGSK